MLTIAPWAFLQRGRRGLRQEQRRLEVGAHQVVPVGGVDLADGRGMERRRVVDQRVEPAVGAERALDQRRQLRQLEQVRLDQRDRIGADAVELRLQQARFAGRRAVVQHQVRAGAVQAAADGRTHALGPPGDQHDLALHASILTLSARLRRNLAHRLDSPTPTMHRPAPSLPEPDAAARAHSARVVAGVRAELDAAGGWMPLADYLQYVLYAPGLGYYAAGARKFGAAGDFVTAPEMTPLFGAALAVQVDAILAATAGREIVEFGAGTGRLAADLLIALDARGALPSRYAIVEVSPDLAERQRATIAVAAPALAGAGRVAVGRAAEDRRRRGAERGARRDPAARRRAARRRAARARRGLERRRAVVRLRRPAGEAAPAAAPRSARRARFPALAAARFPEGVDYLSEINPAAEALVETIGRRLAGGALLIVDYGFPAAEYYHPQRDEGTLMGHYRHRAHADPFLWPGLSDLTAHVDFSAIADAGLRAGLEVEGFTAQAPFLLGCGILDALAALGEPGTPAVLRETAAVQKLLSPAEMGELFKVLALSRTPGIGWPGFALADRAHRL